MEKTYTLTGAQDIAGKARREARAIVVTPVGLQGRGGIDRLNLYLNEYLSQRGTAADIEFIGSRGEWPDPLWVFTFAGALVRFAWACLSGQHDIAHIHVSTNGSALRKVVFGKVARLFRMPYVIQFHGMMSEEIEHERKPWFRALGALARNAAGVIVLGEAYRGPFERMGVKPDLISIVHNGIPDIGKNVSIPRPRQDTVNIVFSGELAERKGAHLLLAALAGMKDSPVLWRCTIAGNGELEPLAKVARDYGIADRIDFTGWIDIARVHELMRAADIVVLPSRAEALPLALIEGASAGAALVATDVGAVRDVAIDGVNGMVVERNAAAIENALRQLVEDSELRQRMQQESRRIYCERFEISKFAAAIRGAHEKYRRR